MLQAVDGVALKWAVDAWARAPVDERAPLFAGAMALRWTEYSLQSYSNMLLGLTLLLFAGAIALGTRYPCWLAWSAAGSGIAWSGGDGFRTAGLLAALLLMRSPSRQIHAIVTSYL